MGNVFGITRCLNEADIAESSIRRALRQVDHVIIGVGPSSDGTTEILEALAAEGLPITLLEDGALNWHQREVMTRFAQLAGEAGASWVAPFDFDEVWLAPGHDRLGDALESLPDDLMVVVASNVTHVATAEDDPDEADPIARMRWRNAIRLPLGKVACRVRWDLEIGHGNHTANYAVPVNVFEGLIEIRHFPYRTPEQFITRVKGAWPMLRDSGLPESHGSHMWLYGRELDKGGPEALRAWFRDGMFFEDPASNPELVLDPCP